MNGIVGIIGDAGRRDFFYLDSGFQLKQRTWNGTEWVIHWIEHGGVFTTVPAVVSTMGRNPQVESPVLEQRIDAFGLGVDYAMYQKTFWGAAVPHPGPWERLGGVFRSAPAAIWLDGQLHVFVLGADLSMWWRTWDGSAWSPEWTRIGGYFSSTPVLASWAPGRLDVFARGADFSLRHRQMEGGNWATGWQNLGGSLASEPAAVTWGPDRLDVFAIANKDGGLIHSWWDGDIWNEWETVTGKSVGDNLAFTSAPAAATWGIGRLDVFAVDSEGSLRHVWFDNDAWSDSEPISPYQKMRSTPMALVTGQSQLEIIVPGRDQNMYRKSLNSAVWEPQGWQQLGDHMRLPSQYRISIDLIRVRTPRSLNNDTVTGQCTLKIGNWPNEVGLPTWPLRPITQRQGELGNTAIDEGQTNLMRYEPVTIELHETAAFNYTFANSNQPDNVLDATLKELGLKLADYAVESAVKAAASGVGLSAVQVGALAAPITGTLLPLLTAWLITQIHAIVEDECDGVVAIEQYVRGGDELHRRVIGGQPHTMAVEHEGTDSPALCGAKSDYLVTWSISRVGKGIEIQDWFSPGQLLSYGDSGGPGNVDVLGPAVVGFGGWSGFKFLFGGQNVAGEHRIYAVDNDGRLLSYGDSGGPGNVSSPVVVGFGGWSAFKFLFGGQNVAGEHRIYAVDNDGRLLSYGDSGGPGNVSSPMLVGAVGWSAFKFLFGGQNVAGEHRIYAVVA